MKILLVFANSSVNKGRAYPEDLVKILNDAAQRRGKDIEVLHTFARSLSFYVVNGEAKIRDHKNHMDLEEYDLVYFRKAGAAMQQMQSCANYLRDRGVPFYDTELLKASSRNKLSQMFMLQRRNLPIPATLFCRNRTRLIRLVTKKYKQQFPFPLIVKATGGSRGDSNYLVANEEELKKTIIDNPKRSFMVQACVPNDGDYRFFVAGGVVRGVIHRSQVEGSHLSNTSMGASAELVDLSSISDVMVKDAQFAAQVTGRNVAGVDIIVDKVTGKHYILEVNRAPQIERASFEAEKGDWLIDAFESSVINHEVQSPAKKLGDMQVVGAKEHVGIIVGDDREEIVKAKVDTGAYTSSIHVENINEAEGVLHFTIGSHEVATSDYVQKKVRSSSGEVQLRYVVPIQLRLGENVYKTKVSLSDRADMRYPMLIGRKFLTSKRLLVRTDVAYMMDIKDNRKQEIL